jgi:hypothetical protein
MAGAANAVKSEYPFTAVVLESSGVAEPLLSVPNVTLPMSSSVAG